METARAAARVAACTLARWRVLVVRRWRGLFGKLGQQGGRRGRVVGQGLHRLQAAQHGAGAGFRLADLGTGCLQRALDAGQRIAETAELRLHGAQHLPDLRGTPLDGQRAEAHLQAVQQGGQIGRPADIDPQAVQFVQQPGTPQDFGIQAFGGQEHDGEIRGVRRRDVFVRDGARLQLHRARERGGRGPRGVRVVGLFGVDQALVFLLGEFGVQRQPHRLAVIGAARQADGELHDGIAARDGLDVAAVLVRRHGVFQQTGQLHLAPGAARLDVGQHPLQVAHPRGQALHFTQALVHGFQPFRHQPEGFAQALLQRGMQFFVHRAPHLVQLAGVFRLQGQEALVHGLPDLLQAPVVHVGQALDLLAEDRAETPQGVRGFRARGQRITRQGGAQRFQLAAQFHPQVAHGVAELAAQAALAFREFAAQCGRRPLLFRQADGQLIRPPG